MDAETRIRILSRIGDSIRIENFKKIKIDITSTNEKWGGFIADFILATVTEADTRDASRKVYLAIKMGKSLENISSLTELCGRESLFYGEILPTFHQFQSEKKITNTFEAVPKCYGTFSFDNSESIILEDLTKKGYALHDITKPMDLQHIHLVLRNLAQFHALSFALRDQKRDEYDELTFDYYSVSKKFIHEMASHSRGEDVPEKLIEAGRHDLAAKYDEVVGRNQSAVVLGIIDDVPKEAVITHGDSHNNNFLFQYENNDGKRPLNVAIIDGQVSALHSPVIDVSVFLYSCASGDDLSKLDELLRFYHCNLSNFMRDLGSDAEKLFPYSVLVDHWKKYSLYALISAAFILKMFLTQEDIVSSEGEEDMKYHVLKKAWLYKERLVSFVDHHFNFVLTS